MTIATKMIIKIIAHASQHAGFSQIRSHMLKAGHNMLQIERSLLTNPTKDNTEVYIGEGAFSIVQLKIYRGVKVAVKQYRTKTLKSDVLHEASIISSLCHPYLPLFFGLCTESTPYQLVVQFHGIGMETVTLSREICEKMVIKDDILLLVLCSQLLEAIKYIHSTPQILHNDIKPDNILLTQVQTQEISSQCIFKYQVVLIDFGKATPISSAKRFDLTEQEKVQYLTKYPHIAPEVVHEQSKQTIQSDIYAVGVTFCVLLDHNLFSSLPQDSAKEFQALTAKCKRVTYEVQKSHLW